MWCGGMGESAALLMRGGGLEIFGDLLGRGQNFSISHH